MFVKGRLELFETEMWTIIRNDDQIGSMRGDSRQKRSSIERRQRAKA
jgi:hypothetical protein